MTKIKPRMPICRILQSQGFGSRKDCVHLIWQQLVQVQGETITDPNREFDVADLTFQVGTKEWTFQSKLFLKAWKTAGLECTHSPLHHDSVYSLFPPQFTERGLVSAGRLDVDTTGLILMSDDGQFVHHVTSPKREIPKTYLIELKHATDESIVKTLLSGVELRDEKQVFQAKSAELVAPTTLKMTIREGRYHQVKRMVAAAGNRVESLHRESVGLVSLDGLKPGEWDYLSASELESLGWKDSK